jgi:hypothetical protein
LCSAKIEGVGSALEKLVCEMNYKSEYSLEIKMKDAPVSELWNVSAFDNLTGLIELTMYGCPPLPMYRLQMLSSLKNLQLYGGSSILFLSVEGESHAKYQFPAERIIISQWDANAKKLTQLLTYFPKLSELNMSLCEKITGIAVVEEQATETLAPTSSDNKVDDNAESEQHQQQEGTRREEEAEGLLLLPSQLQKLWIDHCPELSLCSSPVDPNREAGRTSAGQGLQGLHSLRWLEISYCPKFLSSYSSSSSLSLPFPTSLERLSLFGTVGTATPLLLSYLTSLTDLSIKECGDLRGEGLWPLLAHGHLTKLSISRTPNFFAGSQPSVPQEQEFPSSSSKLQKLWTDDVAGVLAVPICILLSSSLTELYFWENQEVHRFTKEQEEVLQLLTSLEEIRFWECDKLRDLPVGLQRLPNLKRLYIDGCAAIRSLHKYGLPGSLQELVIKDCPAIRSLPKVDDLPSLLLVLDVHHCNSKRLRRQYRKLIGAIPIVRV